MERNSKYLPIIIGAVFALGTLLGSLMNAPAEDSLVAKNNSKSKLNKLIDFINNEYVDSINTDSIVNLTVDNILAKLDPHSIYIPPSEQAQVAESMRGDFVGIGINFYMYKDSVAVIKPVENGPSAKAGLKSGDRILFAGKSQLYGRKLPSDSLFAKLKGEKGSEIELTVFRKSEQKKLKFRIKRDVIPLKSVDIALLLDNRTGYIKINRFAETTYREFKTGLSRLQQNGMKSLIIDLRDNGGGYMEEAVAIADEFLKNKQLIVFTKSKNAETEKIYATDKGSFEEGDVTILINENSASASEILAGAIQDNDRGTIVGRRSFGKGLVQREMDFNDGSVVRLTVSRYYTPTGRSIQRPYVNGNDQYFKESELRINSGELYSRDSIKIADSLKFKTPKGKIVYGGGGIVPDVFVPIEAEHGNENVAYLMQTGVVGHFVFEELDQNRNAFNGISYGAFLKKMKTSDAYFLKFKNYILRSGLELHMDKTKNLVKRHITAELARQLYGEMYYYDVILKEDTMIKIALNSKK